MKNCYIFLGIIFFVIFSGVKADVMAQSDPVLYFCERYDSDDGEVGISDRFTTGYLTVMVKCNYALNLTDCTVQFDQYNPRTRDFEFYKKFDYTIEPDMKYVFFAKNDDSDMKFDDAGIYRVFLLNAKGKTIASSLIEIVD